MPFSSNVHSSPQSNIDIKEERRQIIEQVSKLSEQYTSKQNELHNINVDLDTFRSHHNSIKAEFESVVLDLSSIKKQKEQTLVDLNLITDKSKIIFEKNVNLGKENEFFSAEIKQKQNFCSELLAQISDLKKEKQKNEQECEQLKKTIQLKKEEASNDQIKFVEQIEIFTNNLNTKKAELSQLQNEVFLLEQQKIAVKESLVNLDEEYKKNKIYYDSLIAKAKITIDQMQSDSEQFVVKKTLELEEREGFVSNREKYLKEKEGTLLNVRLQLEKIHNKKIPIQI